MRKTSTMILFLILGLFLVGCAQQESVAGGGTPVPQNEAKPMPVPSPEPVPETTTQETTQGTIAPEGQATTEQVKEFKVAMKQFSFEPSEIVVNKGDKVRLIVTSVDVPHGIAITEYGINKRIDAGKTEAIEFTADKEGTFTVFCSVFCGSGHSNMKGKITVK